MTLEQLLYVLLAATQVGVLVWYFGTQRKKSQLEKRKKEELTRKYPYEGLRELQFNSIPSFVLANAPEEEFFIYALIADWNLGGDIVTLGVRVTGETSLYVKSGGGIIGAGEHASVIAAAQELLFRARATSSLFEEYKSTPLPSSGKVAIYLLTNQGNMKVEDDAELMNRKHSKLYPLFEQLNLVIAEIRKTAPMATV
jgi:hypothetical protein